MVNWLLSVIFKDVFEETIKALTMASVVVISGYKPAVTFICTISVAVGTPEGLQLVAVFQSEVPAPAVQVLLGAWANVVFRPNRQKAIIIRPIDFFKISIVFIIIYVVV